ncbi:MAG TPA: hypothetical protein PKD59_08595 [Miltoncostaeaceae bacterium]|nr:hypothetical protein [Miltoncostaeaceae bacterium]
MSSPEAHRPGFLVVRAGDDGTYVGGLMVTDVSGLPVDFRYTDPVTPTRLQRALYGAVLDRYLRSEVVLRTLLDALEGPPSLLLVDDADLLGEAIDGFPVALVAPSKAEPIGPVGAQSAEGAGTFLLQADPSGHPLRVSLPAGSPHEAAVAGALVALSARMDVLEPVARVQDALDVIVAGEAAA